MMADDVKIQLGIDVDALKRSATEATSVLQKAFEAQNLGSNLLGSGAPATQLPAQAGSKDTLRGVIDALERLDRTMTAGFTSLGGLGATGISTATGGTVGAGRGGGGGGGAGGAAAAASGIGGFGIAQVLERAGDLAAALMPSTMNAFMSHGYGTDMAQLAATAVHQIPVAGKLLGAMIDPFISELKGNDQFKNTQYELYRDVGKGSMDAFTDMWTPQKDSDDSGTFEQFTKKYGFTRAETAGMIRSGAKQGLSYGGGGGMDAIFNMQGALGLGEEGTQAAGAFRKAGGGEGREMDIFASAIGVAVQTGLERGRWGEMLNMWQKAAQSSIDTDVSLKGVTDQAAGIGSLGERFKGYTAAAGSMASALQGTTSNTGDALSLRNAMRLEGGDYKKAVARMARSAQTPDPELDDAAINDVMQLDSVQKYMASSSEDGLDAAAFDAHMFHTDISQLKFVDLLRKKKQLKGGNIFNGPSQEAVGVAKEAINPSDEDWSKAVGIAMGPRIGEMWKQRVSDLSKIQEPGGVKTTQQKLDDASKKRMDNLQTDPSSRPTPATISSGQDSIIIPGFTDGGRGAGVDVVGMSGLGQLSATEIRSAAESAGIPEETMRSWFKIESAGRLEPDAGDIDPKKGITARGFNRMSLEEAQSLGYSKADWMRMSSDKKLSLDASAKLAAKYYKTAKEQAPAGWSDSDKLHYMKYQHGGQGYMNRAFKDYRGQHGGHDPTSWDDFYQTEEPRLSGSPGHGEKGALQNANKLEVVHKIEVTTPPGMSVRSSSPSVSRPPGQMVGGKR